MGAINPNSITGTLLEDIAIGWSKNLTRHSAGWVEDLTYLWKDGTLVSETYTVVKPTTFSPLNNATEAQEVRQWAVQKGKSPGVSGNNVNQLRGIIKALDASED